MFVYVLLTSVSCCVPGCTVRTRRRVAGWDDLTDDKVDYSEGQDTDDEADEAIKKSLFGLFDFAGITVGSHIIDAADEHNYNTGNAESQDNVFDDVLDVVGECAFV